MERVTNRPQVHNHDLPTRTVTRSLQEPQTRQPRPQNAHQPEPKTLTDPTRTTKPKNLLIEAIKLIPHILTNNKKTRRNR